MVRTVSALEHHAIGTARAFRQHLHIHGRWFDCADRQFDDPRTGPLGRIEHVGPGFGQRLRQRFGGPISHSLGDRARFGVTVDDGIDDLVDRAGADRVVCRVAYDFRPGQLELTHWPLRGLLEERCQRFRSLLQFAYGQSTHAFYVDPVRSDTHQHVGAEARAKFPFPALQAVCRRGGQVLGKGYDIEEQAVLKIVGLGQRPGPAKAGASGGQSRSCTTGHR